MAPYAGHQPHPRPVCKVKVGGRVEDQKVRPRPTPRWPMSALRSAAAPPAVAAHTASSTVIPISRVARAMHQGMLVV